MLTNSLRVQLYIWLLAPLSIVAALDAFVTYGTAKDIAGINQDQLLLGSARTIAEQVRVSDSVLEVTIPPAALELLDSGAQDHVYYRVTDSNGRLVAGDPTLSNPSAVALPEHWNAHDTIHHDNPVRTIAFTQPIFGSPGVSWVVIEVGQTLRAKDALTQQIWLHAVRQQLLIVVLVAVLLGFGMKRGLAPLIDLRNRILQRQPGRFESIDVKRLPTELLPLVQTINDYAARLELHVAARTRFIADASHELRTPLTVLNTQVSYALRERQVSVKDEVLAAIRVTVQSNIRLVNQLLIYVEAEAHLDPATELIQVDIGDTVRSLLEDLAPLAHAREIDLGLEMTGGRYLVAAKSHLLQVMVMNLVDNAIRFTPNGGTITVRVARRHPGGVTLTVADNGPGIADLEKAKVFERFYRVDPKQGEGSGLGLAIVKEIADSIGASVKLKDGEYGHGLIVAVTFPATHRIEEFGVAAS